MIGRKSILAISLTMTVSGAHAFGVDDVTGGDDGGGSGPTVEEVANTQEQLLTDYVGAATNINTAQTKMSEALGLKEEVAALEEAAGALSSGSVTDEDAIEKHQETSRSANEAIQKKLKSADELSGDSKRLLAESAIPYAAGLKKTQDLAERFQPFMESASSAIENASMANTMSAKDKLGAGMYVATNLPGFLSDLMGTSQTYLEYMQNNNVEIPDEASSTLGSL